MQCRGKSKCNGRNQRQCKCEQKYRYVDSRLLKARNVRRCECKQQTDSGKCQKGPQASCRCPKHKRFGKELPYQSAAACTQYSSNCHLPRLPHTSRPDQVRQVRTGNQQDKSHRSEQYDERQVRVAADRHLQRRKAQSTHPKCIWVVLGKLPEDCICVELRCSQRQAVAQFTDHLPTLIEAGRMPRINVGCETRITPV